VQQTESFDTVVFRSIGEVLVKQLLVMLGLALVLVDCASDNNAASTASSSVGNATPSVSEAANVTAFCSDIQAFGEKVTDLTSNATNVSDLVDSLQSLGSQTVAVLKNDAEGLSGSEGIDAQGVINAIDTMATTYNPADFLANVKAMKQPVASFISTYC
jgi:hypothetical protein